MYSFGGKRRDGVPHWKNPAALLNLAENISGHGRRIFGAESQVWWL
jgi:hypothetical protein